MLRIVLVMAAIGAIVAYAQQDSTIVNPPGCGRPNKGRDINYHPKIVGGQIAKPNYWNWQGSMVYKDGHRCGLSVLNSRWVVTAAHCTSILPASSFQVRLGSHNQTSGGQLFEVEKIVNHPAYGSGATYANDIALMKLKESITYTENIAPVCLTDSNTETDDIVGKVVWVTGWGSLSSGGIKPYYLNEVAVKIDSDERCRIAYADSFQVTSMICASDTDKDSCQGDSGGPLVLERDDGTWELIGIVSWGRGCAQTEYPGVYSKVASLRQWVEGVVANH